MAIKKHKDLIKRLSFLLAAVFASLFLFQVTASSFSRGYKTEDSGLQIGMVASLSVNGSSESSVERATQDSSNRVVGIVVEAGNSLVTVSSGDDQALIENEGFVEASVSDINGEIHKGNLLVLSPLKGILMKSGDIPATVIGIATENPNITETYSYNEKYQIKQTKIAKIKISLNQENGGLSGTLPKDSTLARIGHTLAGREVTEIRVIIAMILFVIVLIAEGGIIYGAISSAVTSLGRNPFARKIISKELFKIIIMAVAVLLVGLGAVYAVLRV